MAQWKKMDFETVKSLSCLTQMGLSVCIPIVLCIGGAGWLQRKFQLGPWIMAVGILLGLVCGANSFIGFLRQMSRRPPSSGEGQGPEGKDGDGKP